MSGTGQLNERLVEATDGRVLMKVGAEGFLAAFVPDEGLGIALKIADGNPRARAVGVLALLGELNLLDDDAVRQLGGMFEEAVVDSMGKTVGHVRPYRP